MARISRVVAIGYPHHITQRGVRFLDIFHSDEDRGDYLRFVKEETDRFGVKILSWCLMTNHVHFIAVPTESQSFAREGKRGQSPFPPLAIFFRAGLVPVFRMSAILWPPFIMLK